MPGFHHQIGLKPVGTGDFKLPDEWGHCGYADNFVDQQYVLNLSTVALCGLGSIAGFNLLVNSFT